MLEIDQSIKIERTNQATVLALSNILHDSVQISGQAKRVCLAVLDRQGRKQAYVFLVFAACIFRLLEPHLAGIGDVVIDNEYPGHEADIKAMLLNWIWQRLPEFDKDRIQFGYVGKRAPAHQLVLAVHQGRTLPGRVLHAEDILELIWQKR
jgi:hypothetical protein